jgi:hypothetical protein
MLRNNKWVDASMEQFNIIVNESGGYNTITHNSDPNLT